MKLRLSDIFDEKIKNAAITLWHVKESENITKGQDILEIVTDKATFDVYSPCDGIISKIMKNTGDNVTENDVIALISEI